MRSLDELLDKNAPALDRVRRWVEAADVDCEILPPSAQNESVLVKVQRTTRSVLGALAYHTGGILVDHGWLRFLGSGHARLDRNLADWNEGRSQGFYLVADDAAGGFFAINGGAWGNDTDSMHYWAPDSLSWESIGFGLADFLQWSLTPYIADFYQNLRWPTWRQDITQLTSDRCFSFDPFLWTKRGSLQKSHRKVMPVIEAFDLKTNIVRQNQDGDV